jgi:hypothetical protein
LNTRRGNVEKIKVFVENGVDCSIGDYDQRTAAHLAASNGKISVLDFLLSQEPKAEINSVDRMGGTAMEDAKRHGQEIAAILLEKNGGLLASDPRLIELKREQKSTLLKEQKSQRKSLVKKMVNSSPEKNAHTYIEESLLPSIYSVLIELQSQAHLLQTAMERSVQILQQVFPAKFASSSAPKNPDVLKECREAIENVIARISSFATTTSSTLEALNLDFPKNRATRFAAQAFSKKKAGFRKIVKICAEVMKMSKKTLKEMKTMLRPRGGVGLFSSTMRTMST